MQNYAAHYDTPRFQLYISAIQANAKVTVRVPPLNFKKETTVKNGETVTISLPITVEMYGSKKSPNTVRIDASADVTVTSFNFKLYTADTSVVYPITEWGKEYYIFTPSGTPYGSFKEFSVTNGKEKNIIEICPRGPIKFQGRVYFKESPLVIELQPYESVQLQSTYELSGTRVASQHPVAVFTGHTCTWRFSKCNHVYEQLLPVSKWGSNFIVPPLSYQRRYDSVYLQASQPTQVTVQYGNRKDILKLIRGQITEIKLRNPNTLSIQANHGIQVLMLFNGVKTWRTIYDPFLMTILPTDRFCSSYSMEAQDGFTNQALIVAKTSVTAELRIDGAKLPRDVQWKTVTGTDFSWAMMSSYKKNSGSTRKTISSSGSGFGLYSIGISYMNGYGAPGQCIQPGKV